MRCLQILNQILPHFLTRGSKRGKNCQSLGSLERTLPILCTCEFHALFVAAVGLSCSCFRFADAKGCWLLPCRKFCQFMASMPTVCELYLQQVLPHWDLQKCGWLSAGKSTYFHFVLLVTLKKQFIGYLRFKKEINLESCFLDFIEMTL